MSDWGILLKILESQSLSFKTASQQVLIALVGDLRASTAHIAPSATKGMQPMILKSASKFAVTRVLVDGEKMAKQTRNTTANFIVEALRDIAAIVW